MATNVCDKEFEFLEIKSLVRGYHAYMDIWTPEEKEKLILKRETDNIKDKYAVAVLKDDLVVVHVPYNLSRHFSLFLKREVNKGFAEVKGEKINRGAGYGLEIPCVHCLFGPKIYVDKMKEVVDSLTSSGLL